ncbi:MAG: GTP-binding protein TypA [Candidatus Woykebacteria bacterium RIFCSPHIGHO2_12_FULL_43_10]|uniref:50S ribosomal subunit assembly factor BipA n=2 Tax=Candidatus Woykeibacteriota TaxID=1817899 RepID=A0A1G1WXM3_9BACT|nr:MAG: GTP-binding protein TypA [Candidatus Woykebacteria bacterium RIFCSPHIGHO2_01_FULL_43_29]OGY30242.1 MAG: GTP-binding protein TypA [Candidatus Woykebacteria bacterium RIFCSPHIGHO2_02_FULL_43_16b]OGY30543.1 MAG: GTP-binding protein TypA [Candidatus Woykebacteria bacterium RIFCSPHIGHO2_12_FULL_43_10]OGY32512.1 MAG: GTP-binding protein TypA [Candidatus Woykebacteria bacterium RIFCSPLOWO2_01_FULL_43_14]
MLNLRNVAIIAHVDHGKTTLVDALLRQSQTKLSKEFNQDSTLIMDSNDLEKERGITIFSKNASVDWNGTKINIIDTPGHADFGGEVQRVLKMADGVLLLIDAKEGPMPQTRFVLKEALKLGHKVIVVINKIDKSDARIQEVLNKTFDLFLELGADEEAAYFPTIYCSSKLGLAGTEPNLSEMKDISPIFEAILKYIPTPSGNPNELLQMLVTSTTGDNFKGRIASGRIYNGVIRSGQEVTHITRSGQSRKYRVSSLMTFVGLERVEIKEAQAGDIVALSGIPDITIGETIADSTNPKALPLIDIEEPTVRMTFGINASPLAGKEGEFKTARLIQERLFRELETDVALRVEESGGSWIVSGRGELHLAILIERMRREGYEFQVSRPQVIEKKIDGHTQTPFERVMIEVPEEYSGIVMQKMGLRHGQLQDMVSESGIVFLEFIISTKELFGYRSEFIADTRGLGIINSSFLEYRADSGNTYTRERGSLVAHESGVTKLYGLIAAQGRGDLFIGPSTQVYAGQVIGMNSRGEDIRINVCKEKQQTNHRSSGEGVSEHFNTPEVMTLEAALEYINDSELVEVTPKNIRIRKLNLNS